MNKIKILIKKIDVERFIYKSVSVSCLVLLISYLVMALLYIWSN